MPSREQVFKEVIEEHDDLKKTLDFAEHRFVTVERDPVTDDRFVKGHKTMRSACNAMSRAVQEGDPFVPDFVLDLDTAERHEVELFVQVVPKSVEAVQVVLPRGAAIAARRAMLERVHDDGSIERTAALFQQAIDRR